MSLKQLVFGGGVKDATPSLGTYSGSVQEWLPLHSIVNGVIVTRDRHFVKVMEVLPVNFYLKSATDQQTIIAYFASYLKVAPDNLQIRIVTQKADMEGYIARMRQFAENEPSEACRRMIEDNIDEIAYLAMNEAITRRFFLVFQHEPQMKARENTVRAIAERLNEVATTARRYLDLCGLEFIEPDYADNAILDLLYELINKNASRRAKLPPGVLDMMTDIHGVYE